MFSVCRPLILHRKPKLGRTKPSPGPYAGRVLDIAALDKNEYIKTQTAASKNLKTSSSEIMLSLKPKNYLTPITEQHNHSDGITPR